MQELGKKKLIENVGGADDDVFGATALQLTRDGHQLCLLRQGCVLAGQLGHAIE